MKKQGMLIFAMLNLSLLLIIPSSSFSQESNREIFQTPESDIEIINYDENGRPIISQKFYQSPRILDNGQYVKYVIKEDSTNIYIKNGFKSYSINKQYCTFTQYEKSEINDLHKEYQLNHLLKESLNNTDVWAKSNLQNNSCSVTLLEESNKIKILTKQGSFEVEYLIDIGKSMEWIYKVKNTDPNKNNTKFGFTTVCDGFDCDEIWLSDKKINQSLNKIELQNQTLKLSDMVFDTENQIHDYFWALKTEKNKSIFDFTHAKNTLAHNKTLEIDPKVKYPTAGTYDLTIPAGATWLHVKAWGAGGANGPSSDAGGGGGFAQGNITVSVGQAYKIVVGGAGSGTTGGTGGGGTGGTGADNGGGGGGYSGVFITSVSQANAKVIAGGGGGGGSTDASSSNAGAGGGTDGADGASGANNSYGKKGTSSAGGAAGIAGGGGGGASGTAGSALQGGTGGAGGGGAFGAGGGGGGYYGGGGGGASGTALAAGVNGGGGGSGFTSGTSQVLTTGSGSSVANSGDADYVSGHGNAGQDGLIVLQYVATKPNKPTGFSAESQARKVQFTWTASTTNGTSQNGVSTYFIGRSLDNSTWPTANKTNVGNVTSYLSTAVWRVNQLYYVNITAMNPGGNSSATFSSFTTDNIPSTPTNTAATGMSTTIIKLNWNPPTSTGNDPITQYRIDACKVCSSWTNLSNTTTTLNYNHTGLSYGDTWKYRIAAWNGVGLGPYSANFTGFTHSNTTAVLPMNTTMVGDAFGVTPKLRMTGGFPSAIITSSMLYRNGTIIDTDTYSQSISNGETKILSNQFSNLLNRNFIYNHTVVISITNGTGQTQTFSNSTYERPDYTANYYTMNGYDVNYTQFRQNNGEALNLTVNRDPIPFHISCYYKTELFDSGTLIERDDAGYYNVLQIVPATQNVYVKCYNDALIVDFVSYGQFNGTLAILDYSEELGTFFGVPVIFMPLIFFAALFTGVSAPRGAIFLVAVIGIMGVMGFFPDANGDPLITGATWSLLIFLAVIGLYTGKRYS